MGEGDLTRERREDRRRGTTTARAAGVAASRRNVREEESNREEEALETPQETSQEVQERRLFRFSLIHWLIIIK